MARITIEDSLKHCSNIFHLIQLASLRAHQLQRGAICKVNRRPAENKPEDFVTVLALREIAAGYTDFENEKIPQKDMWGEKIVGQSPTPFKHKAITAETKPEV